MERFLEERTALIVGGSSGIGADIARLLATAGASLVLHGGHDARRLDSLVAECRALSRDVTGVLIHVDRAEELLPLVTSRRAFDILVIALGPYLDATLAETDIEQWRRLTELNLHVPAYLVHQLLPGMRARRFGRIILFGGPRGDRIEGFRRIAAYAAVKAGLASLTRSLARQYAADGIRCNMICPGYVATEYLPPDQIARLEAGRPAGRLIRPEQVAALCRTLLHPDSEPINGAIVTIDYGE
jgi:NAD(P)-dependent dehydrogenase (short-subunit alcohol dehydrogenase family)